MAVDTPARIAILGAGPIGLEAGLYGRFLGYQVDIYERGRVCENLWQWGHVRLFSPLGMNCSSLGMAALAAQDPTWKIPAQDALLTGHELAQAYFVPLARSDLLSDGIHGETEVLAVAREGLLKGELVGSEERADAPFCILLRAADGRQRVETADVVIDATGTYGNHNWLGQGGIPAINETTLAECIEYGLADILGRDRDRYAGRNILVVGAGYSAATSAVALAELARQDLQTRVTWITRSEAPDGETAPIPRIAHDRLPERDQLAQAANALAAAGSGAIVHWPGTTVHALHRGDGEAAIQAELVGKHAGTFAFDRIIANVGYRPARRIYEELHVEECYASEGPMALAAALSNQKSADCLDPRASGPAALVNPEPNFYILGAKSYGRDSRFLLSTGRRQIRDLFTIIGGREGLDLYATMSATR